MSELLCAKEILDLLDRIVPRIDAGGPNPIDKELHHCEYTLHQERERVHAEFRQVLCKPVLAKYQPCGCVVCTCEDEYQCQGCGAKHCGTHPIGELYTAPQPVKQQPVPEEDASEPELTVESFIRDWNITGQIDRQLIRKAWDQAIKSVKNKPARIAE